MNNQTFFLSDHVRAANSRLLILLHSTLQLDRREVFRQYVMHSEPQFQIACNFNFLFVKFYILISFISIQRRKITFFGFEDLLFCQFFYFHPLGQFETAARRVFAEVFMLLGALVFLILARRQSSHGSALRNRLNVCNKVNTKYNIRYNNKLRMYMPKLSRSYFRTFCFFAVGGVSIFFSSNLTICGEFLVF